MTTCSSFTTRGPLAAALGLVLLSRLSAVDIAYDYHVPLTPENALIGHYSATKKPVISVKSGAIVKIDGGGGVRYRAGESGAEETNAWLKENNIPLTVEQSPTLQETLRVLKETPRAPNIANGHILVGPIYIEDAAPGDSLEIRILDVSPRIPYGTTGGSPGRGGLALGMDAGSVPTPAAGGGASVPRPFSKVTMIDLKRNAGYFDKNVEVPLAPFMGVMATCPADAEGPYRSSSPPGSFGGNLDCKDLVTGTTLYLPIFQKGGLFYTGDSHAGQGDGEVTGTAIETANTCTLQFILHKGKTLTNPRGESATEYFTFGLDPDLNKAMKQAITETIAFLQEKEGYDFFQAYSLSSIAVNFRVTQVVDKTLGIHGAIPKRIFINDKNTYWYRPY